MTIGTLRIVHSDLTLVQDGGRRGYTHVGVPISGAWDSSRYALVCRLLDSPDAPVFEVLVGELSVTCNQDILIAAVGDATIRFDGNSVTPGCVWLLPAGAELQVHSRDMGPVYVGVRGLTVDKTLGSAATDTMSQLGPKQVQWGDEFGISLDVKQSLIGRFTQIQTAAPDALRYIPGPQPNILLADQWHLDDRSRSGLRMSSSVALGAQEEEVNRTLASIPVIPGAIQMPSPGHLIILGPDAGVTGGYPVVGVVITADLSLLSRIPKGANVRLTPCTLSEAMLAFQETIQSQRTSIFNLAVL
jgi:allophanate hydrolase subunit 2